MSNKRYLQTLEKEIRTTLASQVDDSVILATYGIVYHSDGTVYDDVNGLTYPNIDQWIAVYLDDSEEDIEYIGSNKGWFDD